MRWGALRAEANPPLPQAPGPPRPGLVPISIIGAEDEDFENELETVRKRWHGKASVLCSLGPQPLKSRLQCPLPPQVQFSVLRGYPAASSQCPSLFLSLSIHQKVPGKGEGQAQDPSSTPHSLTSFPTPQNSEEQNSQFQSLEQVKRRPAHLMALLQHVALQFEPGPLVRAGRGQAGVVGAVR